MKKKSTSKKPRKYDPLDSPQWISESSKQSTGLARSTLAGAPPAENSGSGSPDAKGLTLDVSPYVTCPCAGTTQTVTAIATATGDDSEGVTVEIYGPNDQFASGTGSVTLEYTVREADYGEALDFIASAAERSDVVKKAYVIKTTFNFMAFNKPLPTFSLDTDRDGNKSWRLHLSESVNGKSNNGFFLQCAFQVEPFVPDPVAPTKSYLVECPYSFLVTQWVKGYDAVQIVGGQIKESGYDKEELVRRLNFGSNWIPNQQRQEFLVGDDPGVSIKPPPPVTQIQLLAKFGSANVYMIVPCLSGCVTNRLLPIITKNGPARIPNELA